jgi:hypothetical protein
MSESEAKTILVEAEAMPKEMLTADPMAKQIGLTYAVREKLDIRTIGATDVSKRRRKMLAQEKGLAGERAKAPGAGGKVA